MNKLILIILINIMSITFSQECLSGIIIKEDKQNPQDYEEVQMLLIDSINFYNSESQYKLGQYYLNGDKLPQNIDNAICFFQMSANSGYLNAQLLLGQIYEEGIYIKQDYLQSIIWYLLAYEQDSAEALNKLKVLIKKDSFEAFTQMALATKNVNYFKTLGYLYFLIEDFTQSFKWYIQAANEGDIEAISKVANMYLNGVGVEKNIIKAYNYLIKSASKGDVNSLYGLGVYYDQALGGERNIIKAISYYQKAAAKGHIDAQYNLGEIYFEGIDINQNIAQAKFWFKKACDNGDDESCALVFKINSQ